MSQARPSVVSARVSEPLHVLAVAPVSYGIGGKGQFQFGGGLYCAELLRGLARMGHHVRVLATGPPEGARELPDPLGDGVEVTWFALEYRSVRTPPSASFVQREREKFEGLLTAVLDAGRPDAVLLGSESQAWYAAEPCAKRDLKTLLISHGVPTAALAAGIYPPDEVTTLVRSLRHVDQIVTVAHHLEAVLRGLGLDRVNTIQSGVDTNLFRPCSKDVELLTRYGIAPGQFVVGSFSHLRPGKRIPDLLASAELVLRMEPRAVYLIAGSGPSLAEAAALVEQRRLGRSVRFLGELEHSSVPAHMALCDAVVLASEREGCGLVCLEAQASGRPILYSDIPAGRELVDDGRTGLLFRMGDVADLAAKTLLLARDPTLRGALGRSGRAVASAKSTEHWLEAWSAVLRACGRPQGMSRREWTKHSRSAGGRNTRISGRSGSRAIPRRSTGER